jgi:hypothetical protein
LASYTFIDGELAAGQYKSTSKDFEKTRRLFERLRDTIISKRGKPEPNKDGPLGDFDNLKWYSPITEIQMFVFKGDASMSVLLYRSKELKQKLWDRLPKKICF